jgi:hypothetical protein
MLRDFMPHINMYDINMYVTDIVALRKIQMVFCLRLRNHYDHLEPIPCEKPPYLHSNL